jgi:putative serine/threonine protein kinase
MIPLLLKIRLKNITYLSRGKRGIIYKAIYKKQKVSIKTKLPSSDAKGRIKNEGKFLKILNKYKIGPELIKSGKNYLMYRYIEGEFLPDFLDRETDKEKKKKIIIKILKQIRILDKLKINKLEFIRPLKHIFIKNEKITMIDFERCYYTDSPKNVTQFCQFLINRKLIKKNIKLLQQYKENQSEKNFKEILNTI